MRSFTIIILSFIVGCSSAVDRQHNEALQRLSKIDQNKLIAEATELMKKSQEENLFDVPSELWPPTIVSLSPVAVRNYDGENLCILLRKWVSKESGFSIYTTDYAPTTESTSGVYRQIAPRLYWYAL